MRRVCLIWLLTAFLVSFLAVGLPYWQIPYNKVSLPSTLLGFGLVIVAAAALIARVVGKTPLLRTIVVIGVSVPAAVMARVMVETAKDPTSHNLWPLEIIIALVLGFGVTAAGALLGSVVQRVRGATEKSDG